MAFLNIGRAMFNPAQVQYLEEVLGVSANYFAAAPPQILVWTAALSTEEQTLLRKILSSVQMTSEKYLHISSAEPPVHSHSRHMLAFMGRGEGRTVAGENVLWEFPRLNEMLGDSTSVGEKKKTTWALLQQFAKEIAPR